MSDHIPEQRMFTHFLDVPIAATRAADAVEWVLDASLVSPTTFRLVNAGTFEAAHHSSEYWQLLKGDGVNFPDGRPLSRVLAHTAARNLDCEQVRGPSLFEHCLDRGRGRGVKHFLLGGTQETLDLLADRVVERFPGVHVSGVYSPPFGQRSEQEIQIQDRLLVDSGADIVWVALGTPKQDSEALRIHRSTGLTTAAVGAAFDFTAGTKRTVPGWMHRMHLEWLFRLASEPRRLWKRYLYGNAIFLGLVVRHLRHHRRVH